MTTDGGEGALRSQALIAKKGFASGCDHKDAAPWKVSRIAHGNRSNRIATDRGLDRNVDFGISAAQST